MIIRRNLNIEGLEATIAISLNGRNFPGVRRIEMLSRFHGVGVSLVALAFASAAAAQEVRPGGVDTQLSGDGDASSAVGGGVEDIVVTAQRRNENLQKVPRSEEHTSELQSLMRISYAVFCLKKKTITKNKNDVLTTMTT